MLVDANEANKSISKTDSNAKQLGSRLASGIKTAAKWGAALVGAASAVTVAVVKATTATAKHGDEIDKNSQKLQVSAEQYQKLAFAAERCGTSITTIATANKTLQSSNFTGNMYDAVKAVAAIQDPAERAAKATELFGKKAGQEMLPLLNSGADGVEALFNEVEALGGIMSDEAVKAAAKYQDSLTNLQTAFSAFKYRMTSEFLPGVTSVMDGFTAILSGDTEKGAQLIGEGIDGILEAFGTLKDNLLPVLQDVWGVIRDKLFSAENISNMVVRAGEMVIGVIRGILGESQDPENMSTAEQAGSNIGEGIRKGVQNLLESVDWWDLIWSLIKGGFKTVFGSNAPAQGGGMSTYGYDMPNRQHASGLTYVPYDGYAAVLHRGERVVSAGQVDHQDNALIEEIRGLRNDLSSYNIYLDGDALVGGMVDRLDNTLGRRATSAGRLSMA